MRYLDQRHRALADRLPEQVRDAVLGNHVVYVRVAIPTPSPVSSRGLILEAPSSVVEARQMMALPPGEPAAPRMKPACVDTPP
jgi:hypothetical protein